MARNPERIDRIADLLVQLWKIVPDWRLGQIVANAGQRSDPFYVEDDLMERRLHELLKEAGRG